MAEGAVFGTRTVIKMDSCRSLTVNDDCARPLTNTGPAPSTVKKAVPLRPRDARGEV